MKLDYMSELQKKWYETFIFIYKDNLTPPLLCFIRSLSDGEEENLLFYVDLFINDKWIKKKINLSAYIIDTTICPRGYFNYGNTCVYRRRTHHKQWKRANAQKTVIQDIYTGNLVLEDKAHYTNLNTLPPLKKAIEDILTGEYIGRAFTNNYALGLYKDINNVVLLYKNIPIGILDQNDEGAFIFKVPEKGKYFLEEISQYLPTYIM